MMSRAEPKIMKMTNIRLGSSIGGFRAPWLVPDNFNNKSPQYVMKVKIGAQAQAPAQCRFWAMGKCTNPNCKFFHGPVEEKEEECPYADTLVNCGVYAQNVPPSVSVDELVALAKKEGGDLYLDDPKTGSKGVKIPKSKKEDGTCAAFINFTRAKAGKAFVDFLNKNPLKGSQIRAKINSIDEIEAPKFKPKIASPIQDTQQAPKRVKREEVVDEDGFKVAGRNGKAKSRAVAESDASTKPVSRPQSPVESVAGDLVSFDELVEAKQTEKQEEEEKQALPTHSGTWYSKKHLDDDHTGGKKKKNKRSLPSPMETKKLFEGETEKRRAKDGKWYTKQEFYDYYAMVEGVDYAFEQWEKAVRDTKVHSGLSWLGAVRPDIVEMQNAEIEAWGEKLAAQYDDEVKPESLAAPKPLQAKSTPAASTSSDNAPKPAATSSDNAPKPEEEIDSTSYAGFIQQYDVDEEDDDIDFADDEIFSSYVTMHQKHRR